MAENTSTAFFFLHCLVKCNFQYTYCHFYNNIYFYFYTNFRIYLKMYLNVFHDQNFGTISHRICLLYISNGLGVTMGMNQGGMKTSAVWWFTKAPLKWQAFMIIVPFQAAFTIVNSPRVLVASSCRFQEIGSFHQPKLSTATTILDPWLFELCPLRSRFQQLAAGPSSLWLGRSSLWIPFLRGWKWLSHLLIYQSF